MGLSPSGAVGKVGEPSNSEGLWWGWRPCCGPMWSLPCAHVLLGRVSPTGMTEHTKNLLRAFYELSQTHRGKGAPNLPCDPGKALAVLWARRPHPVRVWPAPPWGLPHACAQTDTTASEFGPGSVWTLSRCWEVAIRGASGKHLDQLVFLGRSHPSSPIPRLCTATYSIGALPYSWSHFPQVC